MSTEESLVNSACYKCLNSMCEAEFYIVFPDETAGIPKHCPFCGEDNIFEQEIDDCEDDQ